MALAMAAFPMLFWPWLAQKLRKGFPHWIAEDSFALDVDPDQWHSYSLVWERERVIFTVDGQIYETAISPQCPLGIVIWIDNQFAAFPPDGRLAYGTLANPHPSWLDIKGFSLETGNTLNISHLE
jgi:hypothetical protein